MAERTWIRDGDMLHLHIHGVEQSTVHADPRHLHSPYMAAIGRILDMMPAGPLNVLHLGGGALTIPRYVDATRPGSTQLVAELDWRLIDEVRELLPWPDDIEVINRDALRCLGDQPGGIWDAIVVDCYNGDRMPRHLQTAEAVWQMHRVLTDDGALIVNVADWKGAGPPLVNKLRLWTTEMTALPCEGMTNVILVARAGQPPTNG